MGRNEEREVLGVDTEAKREKGKKLSCREI